MSGHLISTHTEYNTHIGKFISKREDSPTPGHNLLNRTHKNEKENAGTKINNLVFSVLKKCSSRSI